MKLDRTLPAAERIDQIMRSKDGVLFQEGEDTSSHVKVEGIVANFGFHPGRLEEARPEVLAIIREVVADTFYKDNGGGSFLSLCEDRSGSLWAEHKTMEALVCLAIGLKLGGYCFPRSVWRALPGGVPYVWFDPSCRGEP